MKHFVLLIQGIILGITGILPGISIGTMALVLGVYERTIESLVIIFSPRGWRNFPLLRRAVVFMVPLTFGVVVSMVGLAKLLLLIMDRWELFVNLAFFGILLGSIPQLFTQYVRPFYPRISVRRAVLFLAYFLIGLAAIFFLSGGGDRPEEQIVVAANFSEVMKALFFGTLGAAAGVVPGISGSYVLLLFGYFKTYLTIISQPVIPLLIPLIAGTVLGVALVVVLINFAFKHFPRFSYTVVLGIVVGSLFPILPTPSQAANLSLSEWAISLACVVGGILFTLLSMRLGIQPSSSHPSPKK